MLTEFTLISKLVASDCLYISGHIQVRLNIFWTYLWIWLSFFLFLNVEKLTILERKNGLHHKSSLNSHNFFLFFSQQDFTIQQLERKIARLQGERSTEELDALNAKIKELTDMLDERNDTHQLLATQLKRLQVRIRVVDLEFCYQKTK